MDPTAPTRVASALAQSIARVAYETSLMTRVPVSTLLGQSRLAEVTTVRYLAMYVTRQFGHTFKEIGRFYNRDHTTVMHGCESINDRMRNGDTHIVKLFNQLVLRIKKQRNKYLEEIAKVSVPAADASREKEGV